MQSTYITINVVFRRLVHISNYNKTPTCIAHTLKFLQLPLVIAINAQRGLVGVENEFHGLEYIDGFQ